MRTARLRVVWLGGGSGVEFPSPRWGGGGGGRCSDLVPGGGRWSDQVSGGGGGVSKSQVGGGSGVE